MDNDNGRCYELEHSAVKCMRGVLYCYMRQAARVGVIVIKPKFALRFSLDRVCITQGKCILNTVCTSSWAPRFFIGNR